MTGPDLPPISLAGPNVEQVDLDGNALPDVVEQDGTIRCWRNLGHGPRPAPRDAHAPAGLALADTGIQLMDADVNGRADLLATMDGLAGYFPLRFSGQWDHRSFTRNPVAPTINFEDPEVRLVDLDGDGVSDVIRSGTRMECFFFNDPDRPGPGA